MKNKLKLKYTTAIAAIAFVYVVATRNVLAVGDEFTNVINKGGAQTKTYINAIGSYGAGIVSALSGIVALIVIGVCAWKARKGTDGVWDDAMPALIILGVVCLLAGIISGIFFVTAVA